MSFSSFQVNIGRADAPELSFPTSGSPIQHVPHQGSTSESIHSGRQIGSFNDDLKSGYTLRWKNMAEMESWMIREEEKSTVEFSRKEVRKTQDPTLWTEKYIYVCGRSRTGGKDRYKKKYHWKRKVPVKRTGCKLRLTIKTYPRTPEVLGKFTGEHSHPVGNVNARFTRLRKDTRQEIERLLRLGIDPKKVVSNLNLIYIPDGSLIKFSSSKFRVQSTLKKTLVA